MYVAPYVKHSYYACIELTADNWEQEVSRFNGMVIVDFWHVHCPWCRVLNPIFEEVSEEYKGKVKFAKLNVLDNPANREIGIHYEVMGTPILIFFCEGRPLGSLVGFMPKEHLKHVLDDMLEKYRECIKKSTALKD